MGDLISQPACNNQGMSMFTTSHQNQYCKHCQTGTLTESIQKVSFDKITQFILKNTLATQAINHLTQFPGTSHPHRSGSFFSPSSSSYFPKTTSCSIVYTISRNSDYACFMGTTTSSRVNSVKLCPDQDLSTGCVTFACSGCYQIASLSSLWDKNYLILHSDSIIYILSNESPYSLIESIDISQIPDVSSVVISSYNIAYNHYLPAIFFTGQDGSLYILTKDISGEPAYKLAYRWESSLYNFYSVYLLPTYDYWHLLVVGQQTVILSCENPYFPVLENVLATN